MGLVHEDGLQRNLEVILLKIYSEQIYREASTKLEMN
jgi:hypothetical protein